MTDACLSDKLQGYREEIMSKLILWDQKALKERKKCFVQIIVSLAKIYSNSQEESSGG